MTCYDFSNYLLDRGFDVTIDTHEEIMDKLAKVDGDGTSTLVLDEIEVRFHDCFLYYDDDEHGNTDKKEKKSHEIEEENRLGHLKLSNTYFHVVAVYAFISNATILTLCGIFCCYKNQRRDNLRNVELS